MHSFRSHFSFSLVSLVSSAIAVLLVAYIGLIAVVMSYAALTVEFSQSVRNDEAVVATLESSYFSGIAHITSMDYAAAGYAKPLTQVFVRAQGVTALR
jgi:hypothetical protein